MRIRAISINGKNAEVITVSDLAVMLKRNVHTLRIYEKRGILPPANFRLKGIQMRNGEKRAGQRIYTVELAKEIERLFANIKQGVPVDDETKRLIQVAFQNEKLKYKKQSHA